VRKQWPQEKNAITSTVLLLFQILIPGFLWNFMICLSLGLILHRLWQLGLDGEYFTEGVRPQLSVYYSRSAELIPFFQCCGSESGRISIIMPDPDQFQSKQMKMLIIFFSSENFNILSRILKIMTHSPLIMKIKHCKLAMLWLKCF
jgi:hypothetical protein